MDRFNDMTVTGFVTASRILTHYRIKVKLWVGRIDYRCSYLLDSVIDMRFLLLHDGQSRGNDTIRSFFTDMYDTFVKVITLYIL